MQTQFPIARDRLSFLGINDLSDRRLGHFKFELCNNYAYIIIKLRKQYANASIKTRNLQMTEEQKNRMHPGAYKSCLIPYSEAIFNWWYDEQLPATEIQRRLKMAGMAVSLSTITRFIKVRERLAARRQKPENLPKVPGQILIAKSSRIEKGKTTGKAPLKGDNPTNIPAYNNSDGKITDQPNEKDVAEAEAMIQKLLNSTPQQLGVEEEEARKRMKQKRK